MSPILISLSPNTEPADVAQAARIALAPWRWAQSGAVTAIARTIEKMFPDRTCIMTSSGRSALYYLLRAYRIGEGDEVIIQAFTCVAVPGAIGWTGAKPVYADIDETYNLTAASVEAVLTPRTRAVLVQHTFGITADMAAITHVARKHNIVLVEDCAHALGAQAQGKPLGSGGDAALLSFGRDKVLSSVFGGAVLVRDSAVAAKLAQLVDALPLPPRRWVLQQLLHPLLFALIKPLYFRAGLGKALLVLAQYARLLSKAVEPTEKAGGMPKHINWRYSPPLALLLALQWQKLPRYTARRREIAAEYAKHFPLPEKAREQLGSAGWLRFPLRHDSPAAIHVHAKQAGIVLGDWYDTPIAPRDVAAHAVHYKAGSCPQAEAAARTIVNLPTYPTMTDEQVQRVIAMVRNSV